MSITGVKLGRAEAAVIAACLVVFGVLVGAVGVFLASPSPAPSRTPDVTITVISNCGNAAGAGSEQVRFLAAGGCSSE